MPKPLQGASLPFLVGGGGKKILGLAAREAQDRRHQREPAHRRRRVARDRAVAAARPRPTRSSRGCARPRATGSTTSRSRRLLGFVHVTDDPSGIAKAMAGSFGVSEADARARAGDARRLGRRASSSCSSSGANAGRCRTSSCRSRRRRRWRRSSRASPERRGARNDEAVPVRRADLERDRRPRRGATRRASSKTSATPRCSCPTTSATSSRRCPRSRWRPRTPRR